MSRRFGIPIYGPTKYLERRNYGPGVHGPKSHRKLTDFALGLLEKQRVAVIPGDVFGLGGEGRVRICYAIDFELLKESVARMEKFIKSL